MADGGSLEPSSPKRSRNSAEDIAPDPVNLRAMIRDTVREILQERREDETPGPHTSPVDTPGPSGEFNVSSDTAGAVGPDKSVWRLVATTWWTERQGRPAGRAGRWCPIFGQARRLAKIAPGGAGPEGH